YALAPIRERIDEIIRRKTIAPEDDITLAGLFLTLLGELADYQKKSISCPQFSPHVERAKRYISAHLHEPISQKQLALELGITPEYLCAIFKKSEGESLIHYTNRMKLATICAILQNEQIPLSEAAAMYGYADPNYVSRLYKSYFGRTISESIRQTR
ncbi:MAG: helix-turn-helix transcriptional regulator, partial [Ruminococcaceae bacterium]|nr:helix-turn-helix transcriptional regulator [Oscillospiraceae bacterium]